MNDFGRGFSAFFAAIASLTLALAGAANAASPMGDGRTGADSEPPYLASYLGSYLAGRLARGMNDTESAVQFYRRALEHDGANNRILERAFLMEATEGNAREARRLAQRMIQHDKSHRIARLWLGIWEFKRGRYRAADRHFAAASEGPIGELTSSLSRAWAAVAMKRSRTALKLTEFRRNANWARYYLRYHRALIADLLGNTKAADDSYKLVHAADSRTPRITMAFVRYAARRGDFALAQSVIGRNAQSTGGQLHPSVQILARAVQDKQRLDRLVSTPREGLAEVFYGLGDALTTEGGMSLGVIYLQMALQLRPDFPFAQASLANAYESTKRYKRALAVYHRIPLDNPLRLLIDIRRARNLDAMERVDEAKAVLTRLLSDDKARKSESGAPRTSEKLQSLLAVRVPEDSLRHGMNGQDVVDLQKALAAIGGFDGPVNGRFGRQTQLALRQFQRDEQIGADGIFGPETVVRLRNRVRRAIATEKDRLGLNRPAMLGKVEKLRVYNAIAEMMRRRKRYEESIQYYNRIIEMIPDPEKRHWTFWYARGTSFERLKMWPQAERDLLKALELNPDQPMILNYLGYSWVDQNAHLERGLKLIARAVQLKPDDGYIVDSLGWAYYRLGRYEEAAQQLERAVELQPSDPILNDHLGDALWRVGRRREARYQWQLALTLKPEKKSIEQIREKLRIGLPETKEKRSIGLPKTEDRKAKALGKRASTDMETRP